MKRIALALSLLSCNSFAEQVANFATEEECREVSRKVDQTYAQIQDYNGNYLYMSGDKVVNIDCTARITNLTFNHYGYITGAQFTSQPKMIIETVAEFNNRLSRLVDNRNSRDNFIGNRVTNTMRNYGL
jgi:hypothetical protein